MSNAFRLDAGKAEDCYPRYNNDFPIHKMTIKKCIEYFYTRKCVQFKNYWFDNYFNLPIKRRTIESKIMFKIGQFIIHKINGKYSFSKFENTLKTSYE